MIWRDASGLMTLRPALELGSVANNGKPTIVTRGAVKGYSLPIYNSDNEELYLEMMIPGRWDQESDFHICVGGYLDSAETADDDFRMQLSWANTIMNAAGTVANTTTDVEVETNIPDGRNAQYSPFLVSFLIDYDAPATPIAPCDCFNARLRRIAASGTEMDGEFVVMCLYATFTVNKTFKVA